MILLGEIPIIEWDLIVLYFAMNFNFVHDMLSFLQCNCYDNWGLDPAKFMINIW